VFIDVVALFSIPHLSLFVSENCVDKNCIPLVTPTLCSRRFGQVVTKEQPDSAKPARTKKRMMMMMVVVVRLDERVK